MKKLSPYDVARAYYLAAGTASDKDAKAAAKRLAALLVERGERALLPLVLEALPAAMRDVDAEGSVTVESARPLDERTIKEIAAAAGIGPERRLVAKVVPELLGGFRVRTKDGVIDASVRRKVERIRRAGRSKA